MHGDEVQQHLEEGIAAVKAGDRRSARRLLGQVANEDPDNLAAWLYLATVLDDDEQRINCLRQVLRIEPGHAEARRLLTTLERRLAQVTPPAGIERPVFDTRANERGDLVIVPERSHQPATQKAEARRPKTEITLIGIATGIALLVIVAVGALVLSGAAARLLGISTPPVAPTARRLTFGVPACETAVGSAATIVFVNQAGVTIDILQGAQGSEQLLTTLTPGAEGRVEAQAGTPTRYAIATETAGVAGSGATFEVPDGNVCRVAVQ
jgi:hypothetical protein